jgi:hypothetical protein
MQRVRSIHADEATKVSGVFLRMRVNCEDVICARPDMTDQEIIKANEGRGGLAWLNDPKEDVYEDL